MKSFIFAWMAVGIGVVAATGCDDPGDEGMTRSAGGKNGQSGRGGTGGHTGGASAKGGAGGSPGHGSGGRSGTGGGGKAGRAGGGGDAGGGNGGNGGEAAVCSLDAERHKLAACPDVHTTDAPTDTVLTQCSFEATCKELRCGTPTSQFDANGCRRQQCTASDECAEGQRCVAPVLYGDTSCGSSVFEDCLLEPDCSCACSHSEDCREIPVCLPESEYPASEDCDLTGLDCVELDGMAAWLRNWVDDPSWDGTDVGEALRACDEKVRTALDACEVPCEHGCGDACTCTFCDDSCGGASAGGGGGQSGSGG